MDRDVKTRTIHAILNTTSEGKTLKELNGIYLIGASVCMFVIEFVLLFFYSILIDDSRWLHVHHRHKLGVYT